MSVEENRIARLCEGCGDEMSSSERRRRCAACGSLVCGWCMGHVHGLAHVEARERSRTQIGIAAANTLDELVEMLSEQIATAGDDPNFGVQWDALPTFGGEEPDDTVGVWSWDETRLLVGAGGNLEIVNR